MVQMLISDSSPEGLERISSRMPARIEDALNFPVVREVIGVAGEMEVRRYIEFELIKLANLLSVGGNLNNAQVVFIAQELINFFPNETLADFKLCFQRGAIGQYGQIFRMDGIVLREWMTQYLEEKYRIVENKLMSEKDNIYEPLKPSEAAANTLTEEVQNQKIKDRLQEWKTAIEGTANDKTIKPMTDADIRKEGQIKPPKREPYRHNNPEVIAMQMARDKLLRAASEFYKDRRSLNLQSFEVEGIQFGAENEADAMQIYDIALKSK